MPFLGNRCRCAECASAVIFSGNQKAVGDRIVQFVNEVTDNLGSNRLAGYLDRVDEFTDEVTGCNWVTRNIHLMDKAADQLTLRSNGIAWDRVNEITYEMTEILHLETLSDLRHCHCNRLSDGALKKPDAQIQAIGCPQQGYEQHSSAKQSDVLKNINSGQS